MSKINLHPPSDNFKNMFDAIKNEIRKVVPSDTEIHHVGSTAIPELGGKGIIDILIAIPSWNNHKNIVSSLKSIGFTHIHPEVNKRIFMSKKPDTTFGDTHLHLTYIGSDEYKKLILFRDYMITHPSEAKIYELLKQKWIKLSNNDRKKYTKMKTEYIHKILTIAQQSQT